MTILALFSNGKSALTTSVVIVPLTPATSTGRVTILIDDLTSPPPNLYVLVDFSSTMFFLSSSDKPLTNPLIQFSPATGDVHAQFNTPFPSVSSHIKAKEHLHQLLQDSLQLLLELRSN